MSSFLLRFSDKAIEDIKLHKKSSNKSYFKQNYSSFG